MFNIKYSKVAALRSIFLILWIVLSFQAISQPFNLPLNNYYQLQVDEEINAPGSNFHTSIRPLNFIHVDSSWFNFPVYNIPRASFISRVADNFLNDYLIRVDTGDFYLRVTPVFNFQFGRQLNPSKNLYTNTRGLLVDGAIGKSFAFSTSFYENQSVFPDNITNFIRTQNVVPGQGYQRPFKGNAGFDYGMAEGHVTYAPGKYFLFQLGHGKHFIGDGYRSLLLSDNSFNYPYFKIETTIWKLKYVNLFAQFQDIVPFGPNLQGRGFPKKFGTFHFLSMNIGKRLTVGLFESIIWRSSDSSFHRGFDFNYLNPVIFYRPVEFSLGSADNALMGLNLKYIPAKKIYFYGQFILGDFNIAELKKKNRFMQQKYGFQVGTKLFDVGMKHTALQFEYNQVQPYVYGHRTVRQNYVHYNQALAHPLMANFREFLIGYQVSIKRFLFEVKNIHAKIGKDFPGTHFGNNIFVPENDVAGFPVLYGNRVTQGNKTNLNHLSVSTGYLINAKLNMRVEGGIVFRNEQNLITSNNSKILFLGVRTGLRNYYYDF